MSPINFKMVSHPINWVTLMLMVIIAGSMSGTTTGDGPAFPLAMRAASVQS